MLVWSHKGPFELPKSYAGRLRKRFVFSEGDEKHFEFQGVTSEPYKKVNDIVEKITERERQKEMNKAPTIDLSSIKLRAEQAGEVIGLTGMRVRQLAQEGHIERVGKEYPLIPLVKGYIAFLKKEEQRPTKAAADARIREMRAKEIEQRIAERSKELIHIDDVNAEVSSFVANVRAEIVAIPARLTRDPELRRQFESVVNDILNRITERQGKTAEALASNSDADEALAEDTA